MLFIFFNTSGLFWLQPKTWKRWKWGAQCKPGSGSSLYHVLPKPFPFFFCRILIKPPTGMFQRHVGFKSGLFLEKIGLHLPSLLRAAVQPQVPSSWWLYSGWMCLKEKPWAQREIPGGKSYCFWFEANKSSRSESLMDSHTWGSLEHPALGTLCSGREICPWLSFFCVTEGSETWWKVSEPSKWNWGWKNLKYSIPWVAGCHFCVCSSLLFYSTEISVISICR